MSFNLNKLVQPECGAPNPLVAAAQQIAMRPSLASRPSSSRSFQRRTPVNFTQEFMQQQQQQHHHSQSQQPMQSSAGLRMSQPSQLSTRPTGAGQAGLVYQLPNTRAPASVGKLASDFLTEHELVDGLDRVRVAGGEQQQQQQYQAARMNQSMMGMQSDMHQMRDYLAMTSVVNRLKTGQANASVGEQLETKYRNDMISQGSSSQMHQQQPLDLGRVDDVEFWQGLAQTYIGPTTYDGIARARASQAGKSATDTEQQQTTTTTEDIAKSDLEFTGEQRDTQLESDDTGSTSQHRESFDVSEMEYTFDERNPLKDLYEDPFAEGLKKLELGDIPSAALLFEAAVQKDPENAVAWRYLGTTQAQNEKDRSAIRALRNCLRLDQSDQQARLAISVSLANEMSHHEACKYLLEWLVNHDSYKSVGANFEEFHQLDSELSDDPFYMNAVDQKHYRYVRDKFVEAARLAPTNPDADVQSALGVIFNMRGEYDKAVDCFKAALSVRSDDSLLWNRLGATLANGNKSDEAVVAYRKALEISPGFLRSRYNLAISLIHLNTYDEAAKQLVQILNMQAAGKGSRNTQIRTRSITSTAIWNTLRTVATLLNRPELYPMIDGRDLARCNEELLRGGQARPTN